MKITVTFDFDETARRAISLRIGMYTPATRSECEQWVKSTVDGDLQAIISDYEKEPE